MFSLAFGIFLLGLAGSAQGFIDQSELDIPIVLDRTRSVRLNGFNVFDVLKKLDICYLKCKTNYCECCQKIKILFARIEVCGTVDFARAEKVAVIGLKVSGLKVLSTKAKLERHTCRPISSKLGPMEMCVDTNVLENDQDLSSFPVCFMFQVSYESIPTALLNFGCPEGNVTTSGQGSGEYRSVATLKVLNGDQAAKAIQKIASRKNN